MVAGRNSLGIPTLHTNTWMHSIHHSTYILPYMTTLLCGVELTLTDLFLCVCVSTFCVCIVCMCVYVYGCVCVIRWRLLMPCGVRPGCPLLVRRGRMGVSWLRTFPVLCPTSAPDYQWVSAWLTCPDPALTVPYAWQPINMLLSCRDLPQNVHKPIMTFSQPIMSRQLHSPWQTDRSFVQSHIQV